MTLRETLIDKQFEMIGVKFRFKDIPEDGLIIVGKKKEYWYNHYKFENIEQYTEWRSYIIKELRGNLKEVNFIDFKYGMMYKYKRESDETLPSLFSTTSPIKEL